MELGLPRTEPRSTFEASRKKVFRADIQGLRAVAVLAVIVTHLLGYPQGGFVGVDIFFVISGYLITGHLLKEHSRRGRISFSDFYRKRVRRLLPAAATVLIVTVCVGWAIYHMGRARAISQDAIWSSIFSMNWWLALSGTDYMQAAGPTSPLQHFWSLAVEEQFYIVWPWVIIFSAGAGAFLSRKRLYKRPILMELMVALTVASFLWALWESANNPTVAYFSTFSRAWELSIGAIVAICATRLEALSRTTCALLFYLGVAGIGVAIFVISAQTTFPAPWALLPAVSSAMVIVAGMGPQQPRRRLLANRVGSYLGDISYSLYLWHFPVIIFATDLIGLDSPRKALLVGIIIFIASALSYHLIEDPVRKSRWLLPRSKRGSYSRWQQIRAVALISVSVSVIAAGASVVFLRDGVGAAAHVSQPTPEEAGEATLTDELAEAVVADDWPQLSPSFAEVGDSFAPEWKDDGCLDTSESNYESCIYGHGSHRAVLLGDSIATSWLPGLRRAFAQDDWEIYVLTFGQCPAVDLKTVLPDGDPAFTEECAKHYDWAMDKIASLDPDRVIMASSVGAPYRGRAFKDTGSNAVDEWKAATSRTMSTLAQESDAKVYVLSVVPEGKNLQSCATRSSVPADCMAEPGPAETVLKADRETASQHENMEVIPVLQWYCVQRKCPAFAGHTPIFVEGIHPTAAYSEKLADVLRESIG